LVGALCGRARGARYRCVLSLVDPRNGFEETIVESVCEGRITLTPRGFGGFGYDPYFIVDGYDQTMAELSADEKNALSHRGKALREIVPKLARFLAEQR
jgi:XTP/dITP diphosphohydrolase